MADPRRRPAPSSTTISIVIPALNEAGGVGHTIALLPRGPLAAMGLDVEVIVVDNASTDGTADEARAAGATVVREDVRGYGAASLAGLRAARGEILVSVDADGSHPVEALPEFLGPILRGEADLVTGTRMRGTIRPGAMPALHRHVGVPVLTWLLNVWFGVGVSDGHCGMRAVRRDVFHRLRLAAPGMEFATELLVGAKRAGLRIVEVPIEQRPRRSGPSKLVTARDGWRHLAWMTMASAKRPGGPRTLALGR